MLSKTLPHLTDSLFLASSTVWAHTEKTRIELTDRIVEGLIDHPESEGPHPFLIIAAGEEGDVKDPIYAKLVASAVAEGFVTLRLDWSFKKKKGATPSAGLKAEAEELGVVITQMIGSRMMKQFEIDTTKVALIAKGLGGKVAMMPESGGAGEKVKATLLLNPPCETTPGSFATMYAPFLAEKNSRMVITSRTGGCALSQIYSAAKDFGDSVTLFTTDKDLTVESAVMASMNWLDGLGWNNGKTAEKTGKKTDKKPDAKKHAHEAQSAGTHP
jgi:hypothetical protein